MNEERIRRTNETGSSGSIYFQHTPAHKNIYEKVYTDDRDVVLFWKTHMRGSIQNTVCSIQGTTTNG